MKTRAPSHFAFFLFDLHGGGVAPVMLALAAELTDRGHRVDLAICRATGPHREQVPDSVQVFQLRRSVLFPVHVLAAAPRDVPGLLLDFAWTRRPIITLPYLQGLVRYLRRERPVTLLAAQETANLAAIWAAGRAGASTRIVISAHTHLSSELAHRAGAAALFLKSVIRRNYRRADAWVAVSNGAANALSECAGLPRREIATIHNGVVNAKLIKRAGEHVDHPWFQPNSPPVVLSAGRLEPAKDFALLLRAFTRVREERRARLVVLGEGALRADLEALARDLGIDSDLAMPGFVQNPFSWMARAAVFAVSSAWEGFGNVIVEALAVGCPVVSTDCPSGPAEILDGGAYGRLTPAGDSDALARAIVATLDESPRRERLRRRGRHFSSARAAEQYLDVLLDERCGRAAGKQAGERGGR